MAKGLVRAPSLVGSVRGVPQIGACRQNADCGNAAAVLVLGSGT